MSDTGRERAPRNRTLTLTAAERNACAARLIRVSAPVNGAGVLDRTIHGDCVEVMDNLPAQMADLLFLDPPYNITKEFNGVRFTARSVEEYEEWLESWLPRLLRVAKPTASVYICGDWRSSTAIQRCAERHLIVRNRITWEREKGRGAQANWKSCSEDIWFCTMSEQYTFNADDVKLKRQVIAPYRDEAGAPKDWEETACGRYRLTSPSNIWTDLTVPFWSMPENTDHPTQKPEKLLARVILASSNPGDVVLDPFLGSGTSSVVAKKLDRRYVGIEIDETYCYLAEKRLEVAEKETRIQGYDGQAFLERNASGETRGRMSPVTRTPHGQGFREERQYWEQKPADA